MTIGEELKHVIHVSRLRPLITAENDDWLKRDSYGVTLFEYTDDDNTIQIDVTVVNVIHTQCDVIVCPTTDNSQTESGSANTIARAAGSPTTEACQQYHTDNGLLEIATPLLTTAGDLRPSIKSIIYIVAPNLIHEQFQTDKIAAQKLLMQWYFRI